MQKRWVRWATWLVSGTAVLALGLLAPPPSAAQAPVPVGAQFQVNTHTTSAQFVSSVAVAADGDFVVVWESYGSPGTDTSGFSVQGQRYASNGSTQGAQFQVNTYTASYQRYPSVAAAADGDFVVVWHSYGSPGTDTDYWSIQGQRYGSNGSMQGTEFQINTYTTSSQYQASVAADADGDFVVVWWSYGSYGTDTSVSSIQGQRYASDGSAQAAQFQVNTYTLGQELEPSVAADADGDFVVVWRSQGSFGTDTSDSSIQGQRYASNGSTQGGEFQVNTYTTSYQGRAFVAADADADFVVVWRSQGSFETDTSDSSIQGQRYASNGSTQGGEFQVNTYTTNYQGRAFVAANADGDFVVVWESEGSYETDTSESSIQSQRFASDGSTQGAQFQINTYTTSTQADPSVAAAPDGDFVVVWESAGSPATDTSSYSIQGQRYRVTAAVPSVPAMSPAARFALVAALLLLGAGYALRRRS